MDTHDSAASDRKRRENEARSALEAIETKAGRALGESETILILVRLRGEGVLDDADWKQVRKWFREAVRWLAKGEGSIRREGDKLVLDPDADPRNADWLRIVRAQKLAGRELPLWGALWLWWLGCERDEAFWGRVGEAAEALGFPPPAPIVSPEDPEFDPPIEIGPKPRRRYVCPSCKRKDGVRIVYGYPTAEMGSLAERGEIALGGCCLSGGEDPDRRCLRCGHEWAVRRRRPGPT